MTLFFKLCLLSCLYIGIIILFFFYLAANSDIRSACHLAVSNFLFSTHVHFSHPNYVASHSFCRVWRQLLCKLPFSSFVLKYFLEYSCNKCLHKICCTNQENWTSYTGQWRMSSGWGPFSHFKPLKHSSSGMASSLWGAQISLTSLGALMDRRLRKCKENIGQRNSSQ